MVDLHLVTLIGGKPARRADRVSDHPRRMGALGTF